MGEIKKAVTDMLRPAMVLELLANFTAFATQKGKQRIKIIARYPNRSRASTRSSSASSPVRCARA